MSEAQEALVDVCSDDKSDAHIKLVRVDRSLPDFLTMHGHHTDQRYVLRDEWMRALSEVSLEPVLEKEFPLEGDYFDYNQYELQRLLGSDEAGRTRAEAMAEQHGLYKQHSGKEPGARTILTIVKDVFRRLAILMPDDIDLFESRAGVPNFMRLRAVGPDHKGAFSHVPDELVVKRAFEIAKLRLGGAEPGMSLQAYKDMFCGGRCPIEALYRRGRAFSLFSGKDTTNAVDYAAVLAQAITDQFYDSCSIYNTYIWQALLLSDPRGIAYSDLIRMIAVMKGTQRLHTVRMGIFCAIEERGMGEQNLVCVDSHQRALDDGDDGSMRVIDRLRMNPEFRFQITPGSQEACVREAIARYTNRTHSMPEGLSVDWRNQYQLPLLRVEQGTDCHEVEQTPLARISSLSNQDAMRGWSECILKDKGCNDEGVMALLAFVLMQKPDIMELEVSAFKELLLSKRWLLNENGEHYVDYSNKVYAAYRACEAIFPGLLSRVVSGKKKRLFNLDGNCLVNIQPRTYKDIVKALMYGVLADSCIDTLLGLKLSDDCRYIIAGIDRYKIPDTVTVFGHSYQVPEAVDLEGLFLEIQDEVTTEANIEPVNSTQKVLAIAELAGRNAFAPTRGVGSGKGNVCKSTFSMRAYREYLRREYNLSDIQGRPMVCFSGAVGKRRYEELVGGSVKADVFDTVTAITRPHYKRGQIYKLTEAFFADSNEDAFIVEKLGVSGFKVLRRPADHPKYYELAIRNGLHSLGGQNLVLVQELDGCEGEIFCLRESDIEPTTIREVIQNPVLKLSTLVANGRGWDGT